MTRKVLNINDCMKTFEGDGIPVTRAFPVPEMREFDPFYCSIILDTLIMNQVEQPAFLRIHTVVLKPLLTYWEVR